MKYKMLFLLLNLGIITSISFAQNQGTAPKIISTIPEFGECNVDPELNEVIIKFDQDMQTGMSVVNSKNMPQIIEKPRWIDKRTFSIPVKLYPNKLYSLLFNSSKFQNFKNLKGTPLNPDELLFQTKNVSFKTINKQAFEEFKAIFPEKYSYASLKGINWDILLEKNGSEIGNSVTNIEFALKLIRLLRIAEDIHLWVEVEGQKFETSRAKIVEQNFSTNQILSLLQNKKISKGFTSIAGVIDSIGYISIRDWNADFFDRNFKSWGNNSNPDIPAQEVLYELFGYPNLIIDVRENSGGNEKFARKFASYFVNDSMPYEKVKYYNEETGLFDKEHIKQLYPNETGKTYSGNIYVLSGPRVMSSNESFILMMKQVRDAEIFGMNTYGSSGNPLSYRLSNDVIVHIPSWQAYTLDGKLIEGNGVEPDIEILTSKEDFQNTDGLLEDIVKKIKN